MFQYRIVDNIKYLNFLFLLVFFILALSTFRLEVYAKVGPLYTDFTPYEEIENDQPISPVTQKALIWFENEILEGWYNWDYIPKGISVHLLHYAYYQDAWLAFLHDAESLEDYHRGMELLENYSRRFRHACEELTDKMNFYTGNEQFRYCQEVPTTFNGKNVLGFFNSFKIGHELTAEEREYFFAKEVASYNRDHIEKPFVLDESTLSSLKAETLYNFALFPDGTIHAALEDPGEREYVVYNNQEIRTGDFKYPNHTILAGTPHQIVVTAGSFIIYQWEDKRLFFVTSKSGHFHPTFRSVVHIQTQLEKLGIHPDTVICTPDIDISRYILKLYDLGHVPISLNNQDMDRLYHFADDRWKKVYGKIDRKFISVLADGDLSALDSKSVEKLNMQREEATYMRSAYHLFSANHKSPKNFHSLVKHFGKLKDAIKHGVSDRIQSEASMLLVLMEQYDHEGLNFDKFIPAEDTSIHDFLEQHILKMRELLTKDTLLFDEYRLLKKATRELGVLLLNMSEDAKWKGKGYFIYRAASTIFFQINEQMASTLDLYVSRFMHDEFNAKKGINIEVSSKIANDLNRTLDHLDLNPLSFLIQFDEQEAYWMIHKANDWYFSHCANLSIDRTRIILNAIVEGTYHPMDYDELVLSWFEDLKRKAEVARCALVFLDASHQAPEIVYAYIKNIGKLIDAMKENEYGNVKEEARFLLEQSSADCRIIYDFTEGEVKYIKTNCIFPTTALEDWQYTDLDSFNEVLTSYLSYLCNFQNEYFISKAYAQEAIEHLNVVRDFINLMRKTRLSVRTDNPLPSVWFDVLEDHLHSFIQELEQVLDESSGMENDVLVTPSMVIRSTYVLSRLENLNLIKI